MSLCLRKGEVIVGVFEDAIGVYNFLRVEGWSWKALPDGRYQFTRVGSDGKPVSSVGESPSHPAFQNGYSLSGLRGRDKYFLVFRQGVTRVYTSIDSFFSTEGRAYTFKDKLYWVSVNGVAKGTFNQLEAAFISIYFDSSFVFCDRTQELDDALEKLIFICHGNYVCMQPSFEKFLSSQAAKTEGSLVISPHAQVSFANGKVVVPSNDPKVVSATFLGKKLKATNHADVFKEVFTPRGWTVITVKATF